MLILATWTGRDGRPHGHRPGWYGGMLIRKHLPPREGSTKEIQPRNHSKVTFVTFWSLQGDLFFRAALSDLPLGDGEYRCYDYTNMLRLNQHIPTELVLYTARSFCFEANSIVCREWFDHVLTCYTSLAVHTSN